MGDSTDAACNSRRDGRTCFAPTREAHDEDEQIDVQTGQPKEKLRQDLANDNYMSADEAVAYGLADMVRARKPRPLTASHATVLGEDDAIAVSDDVACGTMGCGL